MTDFDLVHELGAHNAPRSCSECGEPAVVYLLARGELSTYRCEACLPEGVGVDDE